MAFEKMGARYNYIQNSSLNEREGRGTGNEAVESGKR